MLARLSLALTRYTRGWMVLVCLALTALFFMLILPAAQAEIAAASGGDAALFDLQYFYTPQQAYVLLGALGAAGRARYRAFALGEDALFPLVYNAALCFSLAWLMRKGFAPSHALQRANLLPLGSLAFDWLENAAVVIMLTRYPALPGLAAWLAAAFTMLKWTLVGACVLLLLIALAAAAKKRAG